MVFISKENLKELKREATKEGEKTASDMYKIQLNSLRKRVKNLEDSKSELEDLNRVLENRRIEYYSIQEARLNNEEITSVLNAREKILKSREDSLDKREKNINSKQEANYKSGYADGVSDGLRKIHEITAEDRQNLTRIAMVSAARGTDPAAVEGVTSALRLTEGSQDSKSK